MSTFSWRAGMKLGTFLTMLWAALCAVPGGQAQTDQAVPLAVNVLYQFPYDATGASGYSHGKVPYSELIQGADGNFYGTTTTGGSGTCADGFGVEGCGTIFKVTPAGVQTVLFNFTYDSTTNTAVNGIYPYGGLVQGKDGNFYGTASAGGDPTGFCNGYVVGCGTIFKVTPAGKFTVLHKFLGGGEGAIPASRLILGSDGKFYGTTNQGGVVQAFFNQGTVFSVTPSGAFTTLHYFDAIHVLDGANPYAGLIQGKDGNLYGTTQFGGSAKAGTVFKMTRAGAVTVLHSFPVPSADNYPDGAFPLAALVQASDGNLYGATTTGGAGGVVDGGTLFKITTKGVFTKLWDFNATTGGWYPEGGLIQGSDGNLYGTTVNGGAADCSCGTLYQLTLGGVVTQLFAFEDVVHGRWPVSVPLQGADGMIYLTNSRGPSLTAHDGGGTVLQINNGLAKPTPTVTNFSPASGKVGAKVTVSGMHFIGMTKITFNGTAATFVLKSGTAVVATVPTGATTGPITVTTAGGSATSAASFAVLP